jgi:uncharacterized membrane protein
MQIFKLIVPKALILTFLVGALLCNGHIALYFSHACMAIWFFSLGTYLNLFLNRSVSIEEYFNKLKYLGFSQLLAFSYLTGKIILMDMALIKSNLTERALNDSISAFIELGLSITLMLRVGKSSSLLKNQSRLDKPLSSNRDRSVLDDLLADLEYINDPKIEKKLKRDWLPGLVWLAISDPITAVKTATQRIRTR